MRSILLAAMLLCILPCSFAQNHAADSSQVAKTFQKLLSHCRNLPPPDAEVSRLGKFYNCAPYIVYRGEADKTRRWKDFSDYTHPDERQHVDEICDKINETINKDEHYYVTEYFTEKESEGTWHALTVVWHRQGEEHRAIFAFLFINGRYALGDIDWAGKH